MSSNVSSATICDRRRLVLSQPVSAAVRGFEITHVPTATAGALCHRCVRYWPCETTLAQATEKATCLRCFEDLDLAQVASLGLLSLGPKPESLAAGDGTPTSGSGELGAGEGVSTHFGVRKPMLQLSNLNQVLPKWKRSKLLFPVPPISLFFSNHNTLSTGGASRPTLPGPQRLNPPGVGADWHGCREQRV